MSALTAVVAITGVLTAGIIYGTDAFCAIVQRPALAALDDATVTAVMGRIHQYGDRRLPAPDIIGILAAAVTTALAAIRGSVPGAIAAGLALMSMLAWLRLYLHVAAPINRGFTAAAMAHETPDNARELQSRWDSIITPERCSWVSPWPASPSAPPSDNRAGGAVGAGSSSARAHSRNGVRAGEDACGVREMRPGKASDGRCPGRGLYGYARSGTADPSDMFEA